MADTDILQTGDGATQIALPDLLDTAAAPTLLADLAPHRGRDICLDFENVTMLGTLCLQVLLNARHHWDADGHAVSIRNLMPPVEKALADFGAPPQSLISAGAP